MTAPISIYKMLLCLQRLVDSLDVAQQQEGEYLYSYNTQLRKQKKVQQEGEYICTQLHKQNFQ